MPKSRFIHWFLMQIRKNTSKYLSLQCFWSDSQIRGLAQKRVNLVQLCNIGMAHHGTPSLDKCRFRFLKILVKNLYVLMSSSWDFLSWNDELIWAGALQFSSWNVSFHRYRVWCWSGGALLVSSIYYRIAEKPPPSSVKQPLWHLYSVIIQ